MGKKKRYFAFSCQKICIYQKNVVSLQQQTYPASRKISALRVSLFYYYGTCKLIAGELEKLEVSIRTQMAYILSDEVDIYWFADSANFISAPRHTALIGSLKSELDRSDDDQILRFKQMYSDVFPPSWMTMEVTSFGSLSMLYKLLKPSLTKRKIANFYGVSDSVFE